jgi:hypothetical protein
MQYEDMFRLNPFLPNTKQEVDTAGTNPRHSSCPGKWSDWFQDVELLVHRLPSKLPTS